MLPSAGLFSLPAKCGNKGSLYSANYWYCTQHAELKYTSVVSNYNWVNRLTIIHPCLLDYSCIVKDYVFGSSPGRACTPCHSSPGSIPFHLLLYPLSICFKLSEKAISIKKKPSVKAADLAYVVS